MMRPRVLVVEDQQPVRTVLTEILDGEGFEATAAANGRAALQVLEEVQPNCIVLDLVMPVLDGFAFLEAWRESLPATDHLPVVAISSGMSPPDRERLQDLGVPFFLMKPFDLAEILDCVRQVVDAPAAPQHHR